MCIYKKKTDILIFFLKNYKMHLYSGLLNNVPPHNSVPPKGKSSKIGSVPPHNSVPPQGQIVKNR